MRKIYLLLSLLCASSLHLPAQKILNQKVKDGEVKTQQQLKTAKGQKVSGTQENYGAVPRTSFVSSFENIAISAQFGSSSRLNSLELDTQGNLYQAGEFNGKTIGFGEQLEGAGLFLAKTNARGEAEWTLVLPNTYSIRFGKNLKVNPIDHSIYISGYANEEFRLQGKAFTPSPGLNGFLANISPEGEILWIQKMPKETYGIEVDSKGNVYTSGIYKTAFTLGSINAPEPYDEFNDAFLLKLNSSGEPLWAKYFVGDSEEYVGLISIDKNDHIYYSGEFVSRNITLPGGGRMTLSETDGDIFLAKLDTEGTIEWSKMHASGQYNWAAWPTSMEVTVDGNIAMAGWVGQESTFDGITFSSPYQYNNFVATFLPDGTTKWVKIIKTDFMPFNYNEMGVDEEGNVYVGGRLDGTFEFTENHSGYTNGFYLAKYNKDGSFDYAKSISNGMDPGSKIFCGVGGMAISKKDDILVNGFITGDVSFDGTVHSDTTSRAFFLNLVNNPVRPTVPEIPSQTVSGKTSTFTLTGRGLADEVILQIDPEGIVESYYVEGDQLIITWNTSYSASSNARTSGSGSIEVKISVAYRNNSGTSSFSEPFTVILENQVNAIEEDMFGGQVSLYPNPSSGYITLELPSPQFTKVKVDILDIRGRKILTSAIPTGEISVRIATDPLLQGVYIVQFHLQGKGTVAKRFLKK